MPHPAQFKALFLSQAPALVPPDAARLDLTYIDALGRDITAGRKTPAVGLADLDAWITGHPNFFDSTKCVILFLLSLTVLVLIYISNLDRAAATSWVNDSFTLFDQLFDAQPAAARNPEAVYFIIASEFALNGHEIEPGPPLPSSGMPALPLMSKWRLISQRGSVSASLTPAIRVPASFLSFRCAPIPPSLCHQIMTAEP